jgi:hypothetical protein
MTALTRHQNGTIQSAGLPPSRKSSANGHFLLCEVNRASLFLRSIASEQPGSESEINIYEIGPGSDAVFGD